MKGTSILFVDNDAGQAIGFVESLRDAGYEVSPVETVDDALLKCVKTIYDIAIVDLIMPRGCLSEEETAGGRRTGLALARQLRRRFPNIALVFLTVARDPDVKEWCDRNPPAEYYLKTDLTIFSIVEVIAGIAKRSLEESIEAVRRVLQGFHRTATVLRQRPSGRSPFVIADEYDVQDLIYGLLRVHFEDIRAEEWSPSRAGSPSRIDFLLLEEKIAIEVKKTRKSLSVKRLGEELLLDAAKYRAHPDCRALVCFVYDPEERLLNPSGLVRDVEQVSSVEFPIRVIIGGHKIA